MILLLLMQHFISILSPHQHRSSFRSLTATKDSYVWNESGIWSSFKYVREEQSGSLSDANFCLACGCALSEMKIPLMLTAHLRSVWTRCWAVGLFWDVKAVHSAPSETDFLFTLWEILCLFREPFSFFSVCWNFHHLSRFVVCNNTLFKNQFLEQPTFLTVWSSHYPNFS